MAVVKDNPLFKHLHLIKHNRDYRFETGKVLIEGDKFVHDLCAFAPYHHLLVLENYPLPATIDETHVMRVSESVMHKITSLPSVPQMVGEFDLPEQKSLEGLDWVLVLDRLQDPGNVGTLIRSAFALGWQGVFLIDCVDPFNDKALRAAREAAFKLPYRMGTQAEFLSYLETQNLPALRADMGGKKPSPLSKGALIVGNEGQGIHPSLKCFPAVTVAMKKGIESLNAATAGSILMYALREEL